MFAEQKLKPDVEQRMLASLYATGGSPEAFLLLEGSKSEVWTTQYGALPAPAETLAGYRTAAENAYFIRTDMSPLKENTSYQLHMGIFLRGAGLVEYSLTDRKNNPVIGLAQFTDQNMAPDFRLPNQYGELTWAEEILFFASVMHSIDERNVTATIIAAQNDEQRERIERCLRGGVYPWRQLLVKNIVVEPVDPPMPNSDGLYIVGPNESEALALRIKTLEDRVLLNREMFDDNTTWLDTKTDTYTRAKRAHEQTEAQLQAMQARAQALNVSR